MKNKLNKLTQVALGAALFSSGILVAAENEIPKVIEVPAPVKAVFTPKGFDDNDNAELVVSGAYPNSCYKVGPTRVSVNKETKKIEVEVISYFSMSSYCLMVYSPFTQVVSLGILNQGDYSVSVNEKSSDMMPVSHAKKDQADDFLYATITNLSRKSDYVFQLQGVLPNSCSFLDEVRVIEEVGDVLAVLPIVKMESNCEPNSNNKDLEFTVDFRIDSSIQGQKLIHVRSLNGASVNQVISLNERM